MKQQPQKPSLEQTIQSAVRATLGALVGAGKLHNRQSSQIISEATVPTILTPKSFSNKSEAQSPTTKESHEKLYKSYVDSFNKINAKLGSVLPTDAENPNNSDFRRLKVDENHNMNGVKFHELYFNNSGDMASEIRADSVPFMRLSKDWGSFDNWQLDFRACGMAATEGWAMCCFDPFKQQYMNCFVEKHNMYVPLMAIPVLVVDTWAHAWWLDFPGQKLEYLNKAMKEINWAVVELRMLAAEMSKLNQIYAIQPVVSSFDDTKKMMPGSEAMLGAPLTPIDVLPTEAGLGQSSSAMNVPEPSTGFGGV